MSAKKETSVKMVRTTVMIPELVKDAMAVVDREADVIQSQQIRNGVIMYMRSKHQALLKKYGINLDNL
jgi:hypothetical protein